MFKKDVDNVLDTLKPREREILELRFGLKDRKARILEEIGHGFGVSGKRIRQIEAKALRKLRHPSRTKVLKEYIQGIDNEEWNKYDGIYDEKEKHNEIVDGIKIEGYDLKKVEPWRNLLFPQVKEEKELWPAEEDVRDEEFENEVGNLYEEKEELEDENIETLEGQKVFLEQKDEASKADVSKVQETTDENVEEYKKNLKKLTNIEEKGEKPDYLKKISNLLGELSELDQMIRQNENEMENEKNRKKQIRVKFQKIKGLMEKQK